MLMKRKKLELCGYFDSNFGDDYMQKIVAHYMPEYEFCIDEHCGASPLVTSEDNVVLMPAGEINGLPKLMVTGSGFMVESLQSLWCEIRWFLTSRHIADYCVGCNIEPFKNKLSEWLIKKKLQKFKYISCRDQKSFFWLKKNCSKLKIMQMPDILFALPEEWLPEKVGGNNLGISVMHRNGDEADNDYYKAMAEVADYWIQTTGGGVVLMAFDTGMEDDAFSCSCIQAMMRYKSRAAIVKHGSRGEIINAYSTCSKIIGARFHSAVLAMKMGIDFYPIIYREKMRNLIVDTKYPIKGCDISFADTKDITCFLNCNTDFELKREFMIKAKDNITLLRDVVKEMEL